LCSPFRQCVRRLAAARLWLMQIAEESGGNMSGNAKGARNRFRLVYLLLIVPFVAVLWTPFYNSSEPSLAGVPFFYWYQMLWILLGAALLYPVYRAELRDGE
jgi:hypothetical protein